MDPSLLNDHDGSLQVAFDVLNEMASVGNSVAASRKKELTQLSETLGALESMGPSQQLQAQVSPNAGSDRFALQPFDTSQLGNIGSAQSEVEYMSTHSFDIEEVLSSEQLEAVAKVMNLNGLDWTWAVNSIEQLDPSLL